MCIVKIVSIIMPNIYILPKKFDLNDETWKHYSFVERSFEILTLLGTITGKSGYKSLACLGFSTLVMLRPSHIFHYGIWWWN